MDKSMKVELPYRSDSKVPLPDVVRAHPNGQIPKELMHPCGIRNFVLVETAARACRAMVTAARADGIRLDATGTYRSYERQEQMFTQRYSAKPLEGRRTKSWNGVTYWQKPGVAMAATPGRSNHGLGLTLDLAQRSPGGALQSLGPTSLSWLASHGPTFGFWNSVKSEVWHWPYFLADDIPDIVLEMEGSGQIRLPPPVPSDPRRRDAFYRALPHEEMLSKGAKGPAVEAVQWALTMAGVVTGIDGDFGPATERSVKTFQQQRELTVSGLVDHSTWTTLGLLSDKRRPQENTTAPAEKQAAKKATAPAPMAAAKRPSAGSPAAESGAIAAAAAAHRAGFSAEELAAITMIAGRESSWRADAVNPRTSDRGMWQINWKNLQRSGYDTLRTRLGITSDKDLLDLDTNAAVAYGMFQDSVAFGEPWFPWRGSESGHTGKSPGWDPKGSHTWHTDEWAAEAEAAVQQVLGGVSAEAPAIPKSSTAAASKKSNTQGSYEIGAADNDGIVATVSRCVGIVEETWPVRRAAAASVLEHNDKSFVSVWNPGDLVAFPPKIDGVRCHTVQPREGIMAVSAGLGLGKSAAAQKRITAINSWQGAVLHPGDVWYGGPSA